MHDALVAAGIDRCRRAEMSIARPESGAQPPAIATPDAGAGGGQSTERDGPLPTADRPVAIEPMGEPSPTLVLSRLWNDHQHDRTALFVVPDADAAERVETLLTDPVGVRAADDRGRTFHAGPDRVALAEGGYAAVPAGTDLQWRESTTARVVGGVGDADTATGSERPAGDPWLELRADGDVVARLDGVDALDCPSRERFPYAYERDRDKQIRVVDFAGRPVQRYTGIGAMRDGGFRPVPAPLVPEHMFDAPIDDWWAVAVADVGRR